MSSTLQVQLIEPHTGQRVVIAEAVRFNVLCCGRRWGKTTFGIDRLVHPALKGYPVAWFGPSYKNIAEAWRLAVEIFRPAMVAKNEQERRIELSTGGSAEFWSLDQPDVARGRKYQQVVIDEAAFITNLKGAWENTIRPTLTDLRGGAWFLSTPRGLGYFKTLFDRGQDPTRPTWKSWQMPTVTNPFIDPAEIAEAREDLSELAFSQEYLAQFVSGEGAVFRRIRDAVTLDIPAGPEEGHTYVIGADWGRSNDYTVFAVVDATLGKLVELDRSRGFEYSMQRGRLAALRARWNDASILAEANSIGQPVIDQLRRDGCPVIPFLTTNATKAEIIESLSLAFERGEIRIPDDAVLTSELQTFEGTKLPSGLMRYEAAGGGHDDTVIALAIAWEASRKGRRAKVIGSPVSILKKPAWASPYEESISWMQ